MNLQSVVQRAFLPMLVAAMLLLAPPGADSKPREKKKKDADTEKKEEGATIMRVPNPSGFESVRNRVSKVDFYSTNYGVFGLNVANTRAGGFWPRGSGNAYIFGGGIWFGAQKKVSGEMKSLSVISYNPNSAASWMIPGPINGTPENTKFDDNAQVINKNRLYLSTDYSDFTGEPFDAADDRQGGPNWPLWDISASDTLKVNRYFGYYIDDTTQRNRTTYPKGPAVISEEDVFSVFNDADINRYEGQQEEGHPLGIQVEQTIYSWGFESKTSPYQDMIFIRYTIINRSTDTLWNAYMAPAMDMDIGTTNSGAGNDRTKIAIPDKRFDSLNLAVQWSEREPSGRFGYIGFDFLESPAVDSTIGPRFGFPRQDKRVYSQAEQIGLTTFQNWPIEEDPSTSAERYEFMKAGDRDGDDKPGDKRFLMATGPFNLAPGDTARVVVGIMFAYAVADVPTGTWEDMRNILAIDRFAQKVYDENFLAPAPPKPAVLSARPLNAGVELQWEEQSERSLDLVERGLDFAGYLIQRQRRSSSVRFSQTDTLQGWNLGWKTIARLELPPIPDSTTRYFAGGTPAIASEPARKRDLRLLGAWWRLPMLADTVVGIPAVSGVYNVYRMDTLKRPGLPDSIVRGALLGQRRNINLAFDPYDDENESTVYFDTAWGGKYKDDPRFQGKTIRDVVRNAIVEIMDSISNGHRYIDIGDDNGDGQIAEDPTSLEQNEKLINNVDYYYRLLAYDAGSEEEGTGRKTNGSVVGINELRTAPEAPVAGFPVTPQVISGDGLGGVHDFRFIVLDDDRLGQLFGGDTLEFEFRPTDLSDRGFLNYYYASEVIGRSRRTGDEILRFVVPYDINDRLKFSDRQDALDTAFRTGQRYFNIRDTVICRDTLIKDSLQRVCETKRLRDSVFIEVKDLAVLFNGTYLADPDRPLYGSLGIYKNTFAIGFDFSFLQFSDSLRFGRFKDEGTPPVARTGGSNASIVTGRQFVGEFQEGGRNGWPIPSIGQVKLEIEFLPGGNETIEFIKSRKRYTFENVPYLTMRVRNIASYEREVFDANGAKTTETVNYNYEFPLDPDAQVKGDTTKLGVLARTIGLGNYGLYAYGWLDIENMPFSQRKRAVDRSTAIAADTTLATAGRYYVGRADGVDSAGVRHTLSFTHRLVINGAEVALDFAGMGAWESRVDSNDIARTPPTVDFQVGDKITIDFTGGVLGLPQPGAKVLVAIPNPKPAMEQYTDNLLDQVRIVPNPYMVTHIGQRANSERMIYFTRLPEQCTIQIYTEAGELMQTINHTSPTADGRVSVDAYKLITKGNRLAQSQLLIARITTPNGAESIQKFAIVVGGFRNVE